MNGDVVIDWFAYAVVLFCLIIVVFFFKQKPAYEMRISDWSSDVCSSDLFVGPKPEHIRTMGDKVEAKRTAVKLGLPVVPGSPGAVTFSEETKSLAKDIGYPVLIKAASGGGGRGMKVVPGEDSLEDRKSVV